jgi:hypothetical protein
MATRDLRRPRDPSQLGKLIVDIAIEQADDRAPAEEESPASNFARKAARRERLNCRRSGGRRSRSKRRRPDGERTASPPKTRSKDGFPSCPAKPVDLSVYVFG